MRILGRILGLIISLAPASIILVWGISYLRAFLAELQATQTPILVTLEAGGENLYLEFQSVKLDLATRTARITSLKAQDSKGNTIANAQEIFANQNPWTSEVKLNLRRLEANLSRDEQGIFSIQKFLEQPQEEGEVFPVSVELGTATINYQDRSGKEGPWTEQIHLANLKLITLGDKITGSSLVRIPTILRTDLRFQSSNEDGYRLTGTLSNTDIEKLIRRLRNTKEGLTIPELQRIKLAKGIMHGPFEAFGNSTGEFHMVSNATGTIEGLEFDGWEVHKADLKGLLTESSFDGTADLQYRNLKGNAKGTLIFGTKQGFIGRFQGVIPSKSDIPPQIASTISRDINFQNATADGWVNWDGENAKGAAKVNLQALKLPGETLTKIQSDLVFSNQDVGIDISQATWRNSAVNGKTVITNGRIAGELRTGTLDIGHLASAYGVNDVSGRGTLTAVIGGTIENPLLSWSAEGRIASSASGQMINLGAFNAKGALDSQKLLVREVEFYGPNGRTVGTGTYNLKNQQYGFNFQGHSFPLSAFTKEATGDANFYLAFNGKGSNYTATGKIEIFNAATNSGATLAYATGDIEANLKELKAQNLMAFDGKGARITGWLGTQFGKGTIYGQLAAEGINLGDYTNEAVFGIARFRQGIISGTFENPLFYADVEAENVVASGLNIEKARSDLAYENSHVSLTNLFAQVGEEGRLMGKAGMNINTQAGDFQLKVENLDVEQILTQMALAAKVDGQFTEGEVSGIFGNGALLESSGFVHVQNFSLNDSLVGSGRIDFSGKEGNWQADGSIGYHSKYMEVAVNNFNQETNEIDAQVTIGGISVDQVYAAIRRYTLPTADAEPALKLSDPAAELLPLLRGTISADARITGNLEKPNLDLSVFELNDLFVAESSLYQGPPPGEVASLNAKGSISSDGKISLQGAANNFRPNWFARYLPGLADSTGIAGIEAFDISGTLENPEATLSASYIEYEEAATPLVDDKTTEQTKKIKNSVSVLANLTGEKIQIDGNYNAEGFTGELEASLPFRNFSVPEDEPILARLALGRLNANSPADKGRNLKDLTGFLPFIDAARSSGILTADVQLSGTMAEPKIVGTAKLIPEENKSTVTFAAKNDANLFENVDVTILANEHGITVNGGANSSEGGRLILDQLAYKINDFQQAFSQGWSALSKQPLSGSMKFEDLKLRYVDKAGPMSATVNGAIALGNNLQAPSLTGALFLSQANLIVPTIPETGGEAPVYPINPIFNIEVNSTNPITFNAGAGNFTLNALSKISGTLQEPIADAVMIVERGSIQLPNSRITIEQGGTITFAFKDGQARADLDMAGRTAVTAIGPSGPARYDVSLQITGNLLVDGGLRLNAQADPPDISEQEILALLGQRQLLEGISLQADPAKQLQAALMQVAMPYLASAITDKIASSVGLEYLALDYNPFDEFSLNAGLRVGRYLMLSGRRQLVQPRDGSKLKFDIRLSYRPPFGGKVVRRLSFSIGIDQDRPIKIGVDYTIRF